MTVYYLGFITFLGSRYTACQKLKEGTQMNKTVVSLAIAFIIASVAAMPTSAEEYEVVKGDNLWDISQKYNTTVDDLMDVNNLESDIIHPKQVLQIDREEDTYIVVKGDTLSEIGYDHDVTVSELMDWNNLSSDLIRINQKLTIKTSAQETEKVTQEQESAEVAAASTSRSSSVSEEKTLTMTATAYTAECTGCSGITATGINLNEDRDKKVIAVDPSIIPLGSRVYVEGYGEAIAGDTGGAIKGNRIDIHVPTKDIAFDWGVREVEVTILD